MRATAYTVRTRNAISSRDKDYNRIKNDLYCRLVNTQRGGDRLEQLPRRSWMDLSVICYFKDEAGREIRPVTYEDLTNWGVDEERLFSDARKNTAENGAMVFTRLDHFLRSLGDCGGQEEIGEGLPLYLLTNRERTLGAVCVTYGQMLAGIADRLSSSFYVLPSSIHECLILRDDGSCDPEELNRLVQAINNSYVADAEILSDHVYYYDRPSGAVRMS